MSDIETQLRRAIKKSDLSLFALAKAARVPYASAHGFLKNDRRISLRNAAKIARVLGLVLAPRE